MATGPNDAVIRTDPIVFRTFNKHDERLNAHFKIKFKAKTKR